MATIEELEDRYDELAIEAGRYYLPHRADFDKVDEIIEVLEAKLLNVGDKDNLALSLENGSVIDEALKKAGFADDVNFVADFKHYREKVKEARQLHLQVVLLAMQQLPPGPKQKASEWQFCNYAFGTFASFVEIPQEDESEDDYLMIDAFGLNCSLVPFLDDLKTYGIVGTNGLLNDTYKRLLLSVVKSEATFAKENTDKPAKVKNHINATLRAFGKLQGIGLVFQILILQGLCRWLTSINFESEAANGYREAGSLLAWLALALMQYEEDFTMKPWRESDKRALQPLCKYLISTDTGKRVQSHIFGELQQESPKTANKVDAEAFTLPVELDTTEAKKLFQRAIEAGLMSKTDSGYKWHKSNALLAFMCGVLYCGDKVVPRPLYRDVTSKIVKLNKQNDFPEARLCEVFGVKNLGQSRLQIDGKTPPRGYEKILELYEGVRAAE